LKAAAPKRPQIQHSTIQPLVELVLRYRLSLEIAIESFLTLYVELNEYAEQGA